MNERQINILKTANEAKYLHIALPNKLFTRPLPKTEKYRLSRIKEETHFRKDIDDLYLYRKYLRYIKTDWKERILTFKITKEGKKYLNHHTKEI